MAADAPAAFFSYCRDDSDFALRLAKDLKEAGAVVWIDELDIEGGEDWPKAIEAAMRKCPCMIVILSPSSVASSQVRAEYHFALDAGKKIVPVLHRDCEVPFHLHLFQRIDFRTDYSRGLKALCRALGVEPLPERGAPAALGAPKEYAPEASDTAERKGGEKAEKQKGQVIEAPERQPEARYRDWTLHIGEVPFRISQRALIVLFLVALSSLVLWSVPWLPIRPQVEPLNATLVVDGNEYPSEKVLWVSPRAHKVTVSRGEADGSINSREFDLTFFEVIRAVFGGDERRWSLCYRLTFDSDTKGYKIRIARVTARGPERFDADFRNSIYLMKYSLKQGPDNTLIFSLSSDANVGATYLPVGHYDLTPFKDGCKEGNTTRVSVGPGLEREIEFSPLTCR